MTEKRFKGSHFPKSIVLQAIYWYLRYALIYLYIEELMIERGAGIDHSTVQRWVVKYTVLRKRPSGKRKRPSAEAGGWMRPTLKSKVNGVIFTGP